MHKVLHIIHSLSLGGGTRAMVAVAKYSSQLGNYQHSVACLSNSDPKAETLVKESNLNYLGCLQNAQMSATIEQADIVHVNWWNSPEMNLFLKSKLPAMRLAAWFHVAGDKAPQVVSQDLVDFVDYALACSPYTFQTKAISDLPLPMQSAKAGMVLGATDFARFEGFQAKQHSGFNVGYVGTVHYLKMNPRFAQMSAKINIPNVKFIVCGDGDLNRVKQDAQATGVFDRFDFRGQVADIKSVFENMDVYGYPLCEDTYAAAELNIQEAMYCGIPVVAFPYGGLGLLIKHNQTGILVNSESEYAQAIEYLYHNPSERMRLGQNARQYAIENFGAENAAKVLNPIYQQMLLRPKRQRKWPTRIASDLYSKLVDVVSLKQAEQNPTTNLNGTLALIESLHDHNLEEILLRNLFSDNTEELFETDQKIKSVSYLMASGGFNQYKRFYQNDAYLWFWAGLTYWQQNELGEAFQHLVNAINLGCNHWRIGWYLAQIAKQIGQVQISQNLLSQIISLQPDFKPAQELMQSLG